MRDLTIEEINILNYIVNYGSFEKPVPAKVLMSEFNYTERFIGEVAENLRENGHPIVARRAKPNGYFIPKTEHERQFGLIAHKKQIVTAQENIRLVEAVNLDKYWKEVENG